MGSTSRFNNSVLGYIPNTLILKGENEQRDTPEWHSI